MIFLDRNFTTKQHADWWAKRKINWETQYLDTWDHPHRKAIMYMLSQIDWLSLMEIGMGAGANLKAVAKTFRGKQLGGIDINPEAIELATKTFKGGVFYVSPADNILLSDKAVDVVLSDMMYIYVDPTRIKKHLKELIRITRNYAIFCEFHHKSWIKRLLFRLRNGQHIYNWEKLLTKMGFNDIISYKLVQEDWPLSKEHKEYCSIFLAKVPKQ